MGQLLSVLKWCIKAKYFQMPNTSCVECLRPKEAHQIERNIRNKKQCKIFMLIILSWEELRLGKYVWKTRSIEKYSVLLKTTIFFITTFPEIKTLKYYIFRFWQTLLKVRKKPVVWKSNLCLFLFRYMDLSVFSLKENLLWSPYEMVRFVNEIISWRFRANWNLEPKIWLYVFTVFD